MNVRSPFRGCAAFVPCLVGLWVGCGGSTFAGGVFESSEVRYRLATQPAGFRRVDLGDDHDVAYTVASGGTVGVSSRCKGYEDVPPKALLGHLLFGTTDRERRLEETITVDGRGAYHVITDVSLDGVPVTLDIYVLPEDGCVFDFVFVSGRPVAPTAREAFGQLVRGFSLLEVK